MYNGYETEEIMTDNLILMKGKEKDFLTVYEFDFKKLKDVDDVFEFSKSDNKNIKKLFNRGSKRYYERCKKAHIFDWIIYKDNKAIGNVFTLDENFDNKSVGLKVNIHPNSWRKGYATETLVNVINFLFKEGCDNVICSYEDGNKKAKRLLEKLGFKAYKILNDSSATLKNNLVDVYSLIIEKEDWLSRTSKIKL